MSAPIRLTVQVRYFDVAALLLRAPPVGTMSRRRKHVRNQLDEACPELNEGDAVCRVVEIRGGNQIEVRGRGRVYVSESDMGAGDGDKNAATAAAASATSRPLLSLVHTSPPSSFHKRTYSLPSHAHAHTHASRYPPGGKARHAADVDPHSLQVFKDFVGREPGDKSSQPTFFSPFS